MPFFAQDHQARFESIDVLHYGFEIDLVNLNPEGFGMTIDEISEGFATYLTDLYIEHAHGRETFIASMLDERGQVVRFAKRRLAPIIDTTLPVSIRLLNKNSYEKGGWVLHMLRRELGDTMFQQWFYRSAPGSVSL